MIQTNKVNSDTIVAVGGEEGGDEKRSSWFIKIETIKYEITMHQDKCFVTGVSRKDCFF